MADPVFPEHPPAPLTPKEEVNYRYADMDGTRAVGNVRCDNCTSYHPGIRNMNSCDKVFGLVHQNYTCDLFAPKEGA